MGWKTFPGFAVLFVVIRFGKCQDFGYDGSVGPDYWGDKYLACIGKYQSPINIEFSNVTSMSFPKLVFENFHKPIKKGKIENNGHTVVLSRSDGITPKVSGGPLNGTYSFQQLHFHWGRNDGEGSENTINNHSFPLELHMVFFKSKYGTYQASLNHSDGLAVLSFLFHTTILFNKNYVDFEKKMKEVTNIGTNIDVENIVSLDEFTTKEREKYFTYDGSLTTPPCSEIVTWIEFVTTVPLSFGQIETFRELSAGTAKLDHNFRPTQPLHDRIIYFNSTPETGLSKSLYAGIGIIYLYIYTVS